MIAKNLFVLFLFLSTSIFSQENECVTTLENFNQDQKVFLFFAENFLQKDTTVYHTDAGTPINATVAFKQYGQTYHIGRSEVFNKDNKTDVQEEKTKIGNLYRINRYTESDKAVCYGRLWFPTFEILASNTDEFVALIAQNRKTSEKDFKNILLDLQKKASLKKENLRNFEISTFDFGTYLIQLKVAKSSYRSESSVGYPGQIIEKTVDLELVIINKSATKKQIEWLQNQNN